MPKRLLSLVAPPLCGVCGDPCAAKDAVCLACHAAIRDAHAEPFTVPGVERAWAAAPYDGVPRRLIAALKFGQRVALARVAAAAIAPRAGAVGAGRILVPVPADPWRYRLRGFDPAAEIAAALGQRLGLPLSHCLERRHCRRQVGQARTQRLASDLRIRAVAAPPAKAVLVDDVATTGATLAECARALSAGGSKEILAVTFARA